MACAGALVSVHVDHRNVFSPPPTRANSTRSMDDRFGSWDGALDLRSPKQASRWVADCEACCFKARLLQKLEAGAELKMAFRAHHSCHNSSPPCLLGS